MKEHTRETSFGKSQHDHWQNHSVGMNLPTAALLCTFPFLPAPQNKHCMHSLTCITWEISRRFTHTQRSLHVCRDLHTWGIAAGCPPSLILRSRRVFFLRWCSSVRAWKCQRSHMFISSTSYNTHWRCGRKFSRRRWSRNESLWNSDTSCLFYQSGGHSTVNTENLVLRLVVSLPVGSPSPDNSWKTINKSQNNTFPPSPPPSFVIPSLEP